MQAGRTYIPPEVVAGLAASLSPLSRLRLAGVSRSLEQTLGPQLQQELPQLQRDVLRRFDHRQWEERIVASNTPLPTTGEYYRRSLLAPQSPFAALPYRLFYSTSGLLEEGIYRYEWLTDFFLRFLPHLTPSPYSSTPNNASFAPQEVEQAVQVMQQARTHYLAVNIIELTPQIASFMHLHPSPPPLGERSYYSEGALYYWWILYLYRQGFAAADGEDQGQEAVRQLEEATGLFLHRSTIIETVLAQLSPSEEEEYSEGALGAEGERTMEEEIASLRGWLLFLRFDLALADELVDERVREIFRREG